MTQMLQTQALRFRNCLITAVVTYCQSREDVPSLEEITRIYSFTTTGDPIRRLMGDVYVWQGKCRVTDTAHVEFQCELNASLLRRIVEMQGYIDQVQGIVNEVEPARKKRKELYHGWQQFDVGMRKLVGIGAPQPLRIDAARYYL